MASVTKMDDKLKKNILDLNYNKYLQYKVTAIIISFTYFVAVTIAWITRQLNPRDYNQMAVVTILSILVLTPSAYTIINSSKHLNRIPDIVKTLKVSKS